MTTWALAWVSVKLDRPDIMILAMLTAPVDAAMCAALTAPWWAQYVK